MDLAVRTSINPVFLWPNMWQYGYLFEAANIIHKLRSGYVVNISAQQLYVLYRLCEDDLPENSEDYDEYANCRHRIVSHIAAFGGLEGIGKSQVNDSTKAARNEEAKKRLNAFRESAEARLSDYNLLNPRPKSVKEMIERTSAVPETIAKLYPLKQSE